MIGQTYYNETSPLATYSFTDSERANTVTIAPGLLRSIPGATGGKRHNQAKNRAARRARRISRLTRNGQHL
jgi:hypothetical protein